MNIYKATCLNPKRTYPDPARLQIFALAEDMSQALQLYQTALSGNNFERAGIVHTVSVNGDTLTETLLWPDEYAVDIRWQVEVVAEGVRPIVLE